VQRERRRHEIEAEEEAQLAEAIRESLAMQEAENQRKKAEMAASNSKESREEGKLNSEREADLDAQIE